MKRKDDVCEKYDFLMHDHTIIFEEFLSRAKEIPKEDWIFILLDMYTRASMNVDLFKIYLEGALRYETEEDREERTKYNQKQLEPYMDKNGNFTIYRGVGESSANEKNAISYTVSKDVAEWFANRKRLFGDKNVKVIEKAVNIKDIVYFTDDREEKEIIYINNA